MPLPDRRRFDQSSFWSHLPDHGRGVDVVAAICGHSDTAIQSTLSGGVGVA